MRIRLAGLAIALCMAFASATVASEAFFRSLTPAEVYAKMQRAEIVALDANPTDIFSKHHIPGAKWVAYDQLSALDLPRDKSRPIVFYCMNEMCRASHMAAQRALSLGWSNIYLMPKGIQGWIDAGLPTVSDLSDPARPRASGSRATVSSSTTRL